MSKIFVGLALSAMLFAPCFSASAQQPGKVSRIGCLLPNASSDPTTESRLDGFRKGLRDLGYNEGQNIAIEYRFAEGKLDQLPRLAEELVRLKVDVIVTGGNEAIRASKKATSTIPIVMAFSGDPVGTGFVASLARPGGNITGLTSISQELVGKRLEILKDAVPQVLHVAMF
jgi:putative ABC transport system substrate-binding protein